MFLLLLLLLLFRAFLFGILLTGFTLVHLTTMLKNRTTIESISHRKRQYHIRVQFDANNPLGYGVATTRQGENIWDLGWSDNWKSVMGTKWWLWFCKCIYNNEIESTYIILDYI